MTSSHHPTASIDLRAVYSPPGRGAVAKDIGRIDEHFRRFIALSPFLCLGTAGPDGSCDVTPRGGEPGFVHVLDDTHLAMPDRPGNNRLDSLGNITAHPGVGLLFFVPGFEDLLRVNGTAVTTTDEALVRRFTVEGRPPRSVMVIEVHEAYLHCPKAVRRAGLWKPEVQVDRATYPTAGQVYRDQIAGLTVEATAIEERLQQDAQENLY
jgi:PPOX class probable FMN-dependent enzyme